MFFGWDLQAIGSLEVIACHDVVDIVDSSWSESDFGEISWPNSPICILGLILREVGSIDVVVNVSSYLAFYLSLSSHS